PTCARARVLVLLGVLGGLLLPSLRRLAGVHSCVKPRRASTLGVTTIRRAELAEGETSMTTANTRRFGAHWRPLASESSMRTVAAPVCGYENGKSLAAQVKSEPLRRTRRSLRLQRWNQWGVADAARAT